MPNKTPIKAHRGMAHVPRPTRGGRRIGMPQPYRGGRSGRSMRAIRDIFNRRKRPSSGNRATPDRGMPTQLVAEKPPASMPRGMATERPTAIREPSVIKQPVAQPVLSDAGGGRGTRRPPRPITPKRRPPRPISGRGSFGLGRMIGLPQRFRGGRRRRSPFGINPRIISGTMREVARRQQPSPAAPPMSMPLIRYNGGYVSRAKYGQTDNLKGKK